jgi:hypothetical protein
MLAAEAPGVYAIGQIKRHYGLPVVIEWAYVGRTDSLRRRMLEHQPSIEANPGLARWLRRNRGQLEVWLLSIDPAIARGLEKTLIHEVQPLFNRVRYQERA